MLRLKLQQSELLPMLIESALLAALVALVAAVIIAHFVAAGPDAVFGR